MSVLHIFLFLSLLYHHGLLVSATSATVLTQQGYVRGIREEVPLHNGINYTLNKFLGIPYAKPPVDLLRFKLPQSLKKKEINTPYENATYYKATYYKPICWQLSFYFKDIKLAWPGFSSTMSDDCLYLNIYTPSTNCTKKYAVMAYIHGGSYVAGTPIRDVSPGEYLPRHDVVLVTIQYRLGPFGFFTTGDSEAPGNLGLLDQIEALKWIQNNIGAFCGDKTRVTLLGESAGGSSVSLHYLSSMSHGLFHRGIAVSGVGLASFAIKPNTTVLKASENLIRKLGCENQNSQSSVQCLQKKSGKAILEAQGKDLLNFNPFVDNRFLSDEPRKLFMEGRFQKLLPLMSGFVSNEGSNMLGAEPKMTNIPADYENYLDEQFTENFHFTKEQAPIAFDALAYQYTPWEDLKRPEAYQKNFIDMLSDYHVIAPTHDVLSLQSFHSNDDGRTYMFEFAHRSKYHPHPQWKGVKHDDTTAYKFGLPLLKLPNQFTSQLMRAKTNLKFDNDDRRISKMMVTLFTNFAKSGDPNFPVKDVHWNTFRKSNKAYLKIQRKPAMTSNYHPLRMAFWNRYFPTLFPCLRGKSWYNQCKKSEAPRPSQSHHEKSNPASLVRGATNPEIVLW